MVSSSPNLYSQLESLDALIQTQSRKLDILFAIRDKVANGADPLSFSFERLLADTAESNSLSSIQKSVSSDCITSMVTISAKFTIVDLRVFVQTISGKASKSTDHLLQLVSAIDANGTLHLYSEKGSEMASLKLPIWGEITGVVYDGTTANVPIMVIAFKHGETLVVTFDIRRGGIALAGQKILSLHNPAEKKKAAGVFGYFLGTRTPVARSAQRKAVKSKPSNVTSSDDVKIADNNAEDTNAVIRNSNKLNANNVYDVTMRPLLLISTSSGGAALHMKRYSASGAWESLSHNNSSLERSCNNNTCNANVRHVSALHVFYDVNKKVHKIFLGDSEGKLIVVDKNRASVKESLQLSGSVASVNHIARSLQLLTAATARHIHLLYLMRFKEFDYRCSLDDFDPSGSLTITQIAFDIRMSFHVLATLSNNQIIVFNTRARTTGIDGSKSDSCKIIEVVDPPEMPPVGLRANLPSRDKKTHRQLVDMAIRSPFNQSHAQAHYGQSLSVTRGYAMATLGCNLYYYNTSIADRDFMDIKLLGEKSWCASFVNSSVSGNVAVYPVQTNGTLFTKLFSDTTPVNRRPRSAGTAGTGEPLPTITVLAFNTPQGKELFETSHIEIFANHLTLPDVNAAGKWSMQDLIKSPMVILVVGLIMMFNLWSSSRKTGNALKEQKSKLATRAAVHRRATSKTSRPISGKSRRRSIHDSASEDDDDDEDDDFRLVGGRDSEADDEPLPREAAELMSHLADMKNLTSKESAEVARALKNY